MHKKNLFALGGIVIVAVAGFLWYHYSHRENPSEKQTTLINNPSKDNANNPEKNSEEKQNLPEGAPKPGPHKDPDEVEKISNKNINKFNSNADEDEDGDDTGITVETEADDE